MELVEDPTLLEDSEPVLERRPVLLLLAELSPLMRTEMLLKLLALVMVGLRLRLELSESVLLHGRASQFLGSFSELLCLLLADRPSPSLKSCRLCCVLIQASSSGLLPSRWK